MTIVSTSPISTFMAIFGGGDEKPQIGVRIEIEMGNGGVEGAKDLWGRFPFYFCLGNIVFQNGPSREESILFNTRRRLVGPGPFSGIECLQS